MNNAIIDPALLASYKKTDYCVHADAPFILHIGEHSPELTALYLQKNSDTATFITACNPQSAPLTDSENTARQNELEAKLNTGGWPWLHSVGQDTSAPDPVDHCREESFLVLGMTFENACILGKMFGQNAIILWSGGDTRADPAKVTPV